EITVGISLAPDLPLEQRFFVVENDEPEVTLAVTARLNDFTANGTIGFLNVALAEDPAKLDDDPANVGGENEGVEANLTATLNLTDPKTVADDGRITLNEVSLSNLGSILDFGISGFVDIDGLKLSATIGDSLDLGSLFISLDGESGDTAPG